MREARTVTPETASLSVAAYELNSLALAAAAEAETLARHGATDAADEALMREMNDLIARLKHGTRAMRFARLTGQGLEPRL